MAELMGRSDGLCRGLGGSMHLVDVEHGLMGATGVVGGNLPLALGSALAARLRGSIRVTVVLLRRRGPSRPATPGVGHLAALVGAAGDLRRQNNGFAELDVARRAQPGRARDRIVSRDGFARETVDGSDVPVSNT